MVNQHLLITKRLLNFFLIYFTDLIQSIQCINLDYGIFGYAEFIHVAFIIALGQHHKDLSQSTTY